MRRKEEGFFFWKNGRLSAKMGRWSWAEISYAYAQWQAEMID